MKFIILLVLVLTGIKTYAESCLAEPVEIKLDNSIDTIQLTGRCGNPLDNDDGITVYPENYNFEYTSYGANIYCGFAKNCGSSGYVTVQANDSIVKIYTHKLDTGELTSCEAFERFWFSLPKAPLGYYHIYLNSIDTIIGIHSSNKAPILDNDIDISPNPFVNQINVKSSCDSPLLFKIINTNGETIKEGILEGNIISTNSLKAGIYIIKLIDIETGEIFLQKKTMKVNER